MYTGDQQVPEVVTFTGNILNDPSSFVDVRVRVLTGGRADILSQYVDSSQFASEVARLPLSAGEKARYFVDGCIERGILVECFQERRAEVTDIMFTLFDQERETKLYIASVAREAIEQGLEEGRERGMR